MIAAARVVEREREPEREREREHEREHEHEHERGLESERDRVRSSYCAWLVQRGSSRVINVNHPGNDGAVPSPIAPITTCPLPNASNHCVFAAVDTYFAGTLEGGKTSFGSRVAEFPRPTTRC